MKQVETETCRIAARCLNQILNQYARSDVDATRNEGATKVMAGWAVQQIAIDTLADRRVHCADKPSKAEAAEALKWLLLDVPNNLSRGQINKAASLVESMSDSGAN